LITSKASLSNSILASILSIVAPSKALKATETRKYVLSASNSKASLSSSEIISDFIQTIPFSWNLYQETSSA